MAIEKVTLHNLRGLDGKPIVVEADEAKPVLLLGVAEFKNMQALSAAAKTSAHTITTLLSA